MEYHTRVKLFVEESEGEWIVGAIVCLYDRDRLSRDDLLGTDSTDVYGEAHFRFNAEDFLDLDDRLGGALPELYVKVFAPDGACIVSTRAQAVRNTVPELIRIPIGRSVAREHRLIR